MENEPIIQDLNMILLKINNNSFYINNKELFLFICNIQNLFDNFIIFEYLSFENKNNNIKFSDDFINILKKQKKQNLLIKFILLIFFNLVEINSKKYTNIPLNILKSIFNKKYIFQIVKNKFNQLFLSNIFDENDIILLSKLLIKINKSIFCFYIIKDLIKKDVKKINNKIIFEICSYIVNENIQIESKITKFLFYIIDNIKLTQENINIIIKILIQIHCFKYDINLYEYLTKSTLFHFEKIGNKYSINNNNLIISNSLLSLNAKILFLKNLIEKEIDLLLKDKYKLYNGFIIENSLTYIKLEKIKELGNKNCCSIIFSFKLKIISNENINLLELVNKDLLTSYFTIFIKNKYLYFSISKLNKKNFIFPIEKEIKIDQTYQIIFSIEKGVPNKIIITINGKEYDYTSKYGKNFEYPFTIINSELYICRNSNIDFNIELGTIFLFDCFLNKDIKCIISDFKGEYENIILYKSNHLYNIKSDIINKIFDFSKLKKFNLYRKLNGMISPKSISLGNNNNYFKENYYDLKNIRLFNRNYFIDGKINYFTNLSLSIYNFIYFNGLKFIQLNCELYFQILNNENLEKDYDIINMNLLNIIQFLNTIIKNVNNNFLYFEKSFLLSNQNLINNSFIDLSNEEMRNESNELFFTYSSICKLILILKGDKSLIIDEFINIIPLLNNKKNSEFISSLLHKIINFLLNKYIYNKETKRILSVVYLQIINCFENNIDFINKFYLQKLINMNDDSIEFNKLFDVFLSKIIQNNQILLINKNNTIINPKMNLIDFLLKIIILKLNEFPIVVLNLKVISNILMLLYKNLSNLNSNNEKNNVEKIKEDNNNIKSNNSEDLLNRDNIYKGFILSGLKALQNSNFQTEEYFNIVDKIKAIFIQFINLINKFDIIFLKTLINLQKSDNLKENYIFINGKKSFLSFYSLLFNHIKYDEFAIIISKEILQPNEYQINLKYFIIYFDFLLNLIQNFSKDEIIKNNIHNEKILFYMRENIFSLIINIIYQFSLSKTNLNTKKVLKELLHQKDNLLIQYYSNYKISNDEIAKLFFSELISISKVLIFNDENPFIFNLFFQLFIKFKKNKSKSIQKIIPEIFMKLSFDLNTILSTKKEINENNIIIKNYIQLIILFYKLISQIKKLKLDDINDSNNQFIQNFILNSFLFSNNPFLFKSIKYNIGKNNFKYFQEIIIEIFIELYILTGKNNYLNFIKNNILKQPFNKISYFYEYDQKYIELENQNKKKFFNLFPINENVKKETRKLFVIHYYIKFTLYLINEKKNDNLKSLYEEINSVLKENILTLFSKKELMKDIIYLLNPSFEEDNLYKKVFQYFYFEKYKKSNKSDSRDYIKKKFLKKKYYNSCIKYFKISYNKNGEVIDYKNNEINVTSFKTMIVANNDNDLILKNFSSSDNNLLKINHEKLNDNNSFDKEIDECIKKFNNEILKNNNENDNNMNNILELDFPIINSRKVLCKNIFGNYFKKLLFYNECFLNLRKNYLKKFYYQQINNTSSDCYLTYPSKLKNFSSEKNFIKIFLKPNFQFFNNEYYSISHKNINLDFNINEQSNNLSLFKKRIKINFNNLNPKIFECELITIDYIIQGKIYLSNYYFIFQSNSCEIIKQNENINKKYLNKIFSSCNNDINITKEKVLYFRFEQIKKIFIKRFLYQFQSIEIFLLNGKSYFFNLFNISNKDNLLLILKNKNIEIIENLKEYFNKNLYSNKYLDNKISTFDYLLYINFYSSRSLNDLNQYFIFPWLTIKNEENSKIYLRNFKYPLSAQKKEKRKELILKYNDLKNENPNKKFINHYNSHYSTSSFVNFYLIRISPFNENIIKLQNGNFDNPNRIFYSISDIITNLIQYNDNRELIPEFFYLSELYLNLNYNNYGLMEDKFNINNIIFDDYFNGLNINIKSPFEFMIRYKNLLNSSFVSKYIHFWIDNIFGINQLNNKIESCNLFSKYCYSELVNLNKKIEKNKKKLSIEQVYSIIREKCDLILNFGETPMKLFDEKVKEKTVLDKSNLISNNKKLFNNNFFNIINQESIIFFTFNSYNNNLFILSENDYINEFLLSIYFNINNNNSMSDYSEKNNYLSIKIRDLTKFHFHSKKDKIIYNLKNTFTFLKYNETNEFIIFLNKRYSSITFYEFNRKKYNFILPSIPSSVISISNKEIITGHIDGIIIHWLIQSDFKIKQLNFIKKTFVSNQPILSISYNKDYQIILIGNNKDCSINILKLYNFELISVIYLNNLKFKVHNCLIINQKINRFNYFVYIISYQLDKFILHCFTVNGIKICEELNNICNNFYILDNGNILTYSYDKKSFIVCKGENLNKIVHIKKLNMEKEIIYFEFNKDENCIYYIYKENNSRKINYLYLTNNDIIQIYKEENFFECKKEVKKDIWNLSDDDEIAE